MCYDPLKFILCFLELSHPHLPLGGPRRSPTERTREGSRPRLTHGRACCCGLRVALVVVAVVVVVVVAVVVAAAAVVAVARSGVHPARPTTLHH